MQLSAKDLLTKADHHLGEIIARIPEPKIISTKNVFHDLMSCVLEQQIHYRSTKRIFQKMLDRADIDLLSVSNFSQFEEKAFEGVKLSMSKYETVRRIVDYWLENNIDWDSLSEEEVVAKCSKIKGLGKWTIDMILLYTLERPNVFPYDDFHLKQIMVSLYGLNPRIKLKAQMSDISTSWDGHKSLAVKYLLAWKAFKKKASGKRLE